MEQSDVKQVLAVLPRIRTEIAKVIIGQDDVVTHCLIAIMTRNHALIEGVPGVAKTLLVRTMAKVLGSPFSRIQFTPDLMPADITGTNIFNLKTSEFNLVRGPVFTTFLLADEINRAPAKTQSALLQAMQERKVTIDRDTHDLSPQFTVFATQNPIEYEGTYPLPEAQKDRFMLKVQMQPPGRDDELSLAQRMLSEDAPELVLERGGVQAVVDAQELAALQSGLAGILVKPEIVAYVVEIVRASRSHDTILVGAGPRATQALLLAARALAGVGGRDFVSPDDVKEMVFPVMQHRLILRPEYEIEGLTISEVLQRIVEKVAVPR